MLRHKRQRPDSIVILPQRILLRLLSNLLKILSIRRKLLHKPATALAWEHCPLHGAEQETEAANSPLAAKEQHFPAKARGVIWLFMNGGPSQVDTWDYKPELEKHDGQELEGFDKNTGFFTGNVGPIMKSPFQFSQHGESGSWVSEIFPNIARHVDKMAFLHSCYTESNNHSPALFMINTGMKRMGFPSVGSWVTYGLGTENQNLPSFVTMSDP